MYVVLVVGDTVVAMLVDTAVPVDVVHPTKSNAGASAPRPMSTLSPRQIHWSGPASMTGQSR
eukprot:2636616-Rhodomonas_salina.2